MREIHNTYDEEFEAKQPNVRLFILFLDDYHVRRGNDMVVRKPLLDFVQNQLGPQDMVAVMYPLTPVTALTFTRDRSSLIEAINHFEGRKGIYDPRNEFEEKYAYYPTVTVENVRNDVSMTAIRGAAVRLGGMRDGRKSIIFVSEGFTSSVPPQLANQSAALGGGFSNPSQPGQDVSNPRADSQKFFDSVDLNDRLKEVFDTCNRNNTSIYAVDPRGLATFEYDINAGVSLQSDKQDLGQSIDTLRVLADNTDGRAIVNRNDLGVGMKQIMRDASGYYLLGYTSSAAPTDGKFHAIDVHVKRPGVEVRSRKGYWAYTAEEATRATAPAKPGPPPAITNALGAIVEPTSAGHAARFWIGTSAGSGGQGRVTFVWEALTAAGAERSRDVAARVMLTATAPDGRVLFRGRVPEKPEPSSAPAGAAPSATSGAPAAADAASALTPGASVGFDAPPGQVDMRMVVESDSGQVVDSVTRGVTVPDFTKTQVSFGTPRVYRARTAREALALRNNVDATPTAGREFSRGERMIVRVPAYSGDGAAVDVTAKLLNRAGQSMADVPLQAAAEGKPALIDLPLASLAPGEYILEVDAKTPSGSAQQMIGFKIGT